MRTRIALLIAVSMAFASFAQAASDRVALVIGNGAYMNANKLVNPPNDAADVASALRKLGFDVVEGRDLDKRGMESKVIEFSRKLDNAGMALFFYAGHGMQVGGRNYLIPIDAKLERGGDLSFETLDVSQVLGQMEAEKRVNLVFLDACRDNPLARSFSRSLGTRSAAVGQGLASIQSAVGTMIVYATQPDNVALDGDGTRNSPFTGALLKHIATPGLEVRSMMTRVRSDVLVATRDKQVPWDHSSLTSDVILTPALAASAIPAPATTAPASDEITWSFLKDTNDASQLRRFAEQYPASPRRVEAAARILKLEQTKVAALPPSNPAPASSAPTQEPVRTSAMVATGQIENFGSTIDKKEVAGAAECRNLCLANQTCNAWQYYQPTHTVPGMLTGTTILRNQCHLYPKGEIGKDARADIVGGIVKTVSAPPATASPPEPVRTSAIMRGVYLSAGTGSVVSSPKLSSATECRDRCLKDKRCNAWEYFSDSYSDDMGGPSPTEEFRKKCVLFEGGTLGNAEKAGTVFSGVVKTETPATAPPVQSSSAEPVRTSQIVTNRCVTYVGTIASSPKLSSAAECRDSCVRDKECHGWQYFLDSYASESTRRTCQVTKTKEASLND